jgi:hypothetical protein
MLYMSEYYRLVAEISIRFSFVEGFRFLLLKLQSNKLSSNLGMVFEITVDKTLHLSFLFFPRQTKLASITSPTSNFFTILPLKQLKFLSF